jgi:hypothetical protein
MGKPKSNGRRDPAVVVRTHAQVARQADERARRILGVASCEEAFRKLDAGELEGTAAEAEFASLRWLLTGR